MKRTETREVKIKDLVLGHNNHVYIQSMCNIPTKQAQKVIEQILNLEKMGCEIIRVSCMDMEDAKAIETIKKKIKDNSYNNISEWKQDVDLVFDNAISYNTEQSVIGGVAIYLRKKFNKMYREIPMH